MNHCTGLNHGEVYMSNSINDVIFYIPGYNFYFDGVTQSANQQ